MEATRFFSRQNNIKTYQKLFQVSKSQLWARAFMRKNSARERDYSVITLFIYLQSRSTPVYLKTRSDQFVYRSALSLSVVGLGVTAYSLYRMATGTLPSKSRD